MDWLLDQDILSLDRLLDVSNDARNADLRERAYNTYSAIAAATAGGDAYKDFDARMARYTSAAEREAQHQKKLAEGLKAAKKLFGG